MKKREELKAMEHLTPLTTSFDEFKEMVPDCEHGSKSGFCFECKKRSIAPGETYEERNARIERDYLFQDTKEHLENPKKFMVRKIPTKFLDKSLEDFGGFDTIKKVCMDYVMDFDREIREDGTYGKYLKQRGSILFSGKTGCGKTHLAVAILREIIKRRFVYDCDFYFITAPELLLEIRATFKPHAKKYDDFGHCAADTEQDVLDKYSKCELLILDDLGAEKVSDFTIQSLYLVIDRRNREMMPTIVTTNLSLEEIETQIDARMASRLADMKVVKLTMPDYRKKR